jgi:hypothetical protein
MKDVMLDLETLGNGKNKCIVQIGACYFDRETGDIGETFKVNVDARSHVKHGGELDPDTVYWWLSQSKEAQNSITADPKIDIVEAFNSLNDFLKPAKAIWSHATFDFVTVQETFKQLSIKPLFHYRVARDLRTIVDIGKINIKDQVRESLHHDALEDCKFQVKYCVAALNNVKKRQGGH